MALGCHGESPEPNSSAPPKEHPAEANKLPAELDALNVAARKMYADARTLELSTIPVVIVVSGDDLILRKNGKRTVVTVIPAEYHILKSYAHSTLALYTHLSSDAGKLIGDERLKSLKEYKALLTAAGPALEKLEFDPETKARQRRILDRAGEFVARVLKNGMVSTDELNKFCRASRADILANGAEAAKAQILAAHQASNGVEIGNDSRGMGNAHGHCVGRRPHGPKTRRSNTSPDFWANPTVRAAVSYTPNRSGTRRRRSTSSARAVWMASYQSPCSAIHSGCIAIFSQMAPGPPSTKFLLRQLQATDLSKRWGASLRTLLSDSRAGRTLGPF